MPRRQLKFFADEIDIFTDTQPARRHAATSSSPTPRAASPPSGSSSTSTDGTGTFYERVRHHVARRRRPTARSSATRIPTSTSTARRIEKLGAADVPDHARRLHDLRAADAALGGRPATASTINLDDYAIARNTVLRVKGVPLFYLPVDLLPDPGRRARHRLPAADLRHLDAARPGDQQRVLLGDRPQPGRDVLPRLVHAAPARASAASTATSPAPQSSGNVRVYRFDQQRDRRSPTDGVDHDAAGEHELRGHAATATQALGAGVRARAARRLLLRHRRRSSSTTRTSTRRRSRSRDDRRRLSAARLGALSTQRSVPAHRDVQRAPTTRTSTAARRASPRSVAPQRLFGTPIYASVNSEYALPAVPQLIRTASSRPTTTLSRVRRRAVAARAAVAADLPVASTRAPSYRTTYYTRSLDARGALIARAAHAAATCRCAPTSSARCSRKIWDTPDERRRRAHEARDRADVQPSTTSTEIDELRRSVPILTDASDFVVGGATRADLRRDQSPVLPRRGRPTARAGQTREF